MFNIFRNLCYYITTSIVPEYFFNQEILTNHMHLSIYDILSNHTEMLCYVIFIKPN